jgi:hypothetical protein
MNEMAQESYDPTFKLASATDLRIEGAWSARDAWRYISNEVLRDPLNLRKHVQRIYIAYDSDDNELLFGGLVDLWIALKDNGRDLREAMLDIARLKLADDQLAFLSKALANGLDSKQALPLASGSVLDQGYIGTAEVIRRELVAAATVADPVAEAMALLEEGHVYPAREILEETVLADPSNQAAEAQLVEIFWRSRDETGFANMRDRLRRVYGEVPPSWEKLKAPVGGSAA